MSRKDSGLALSYAFVKEFWRQKGLSGPGWPDHKQRIARRQAAAQHLVQASRSHGNAFIACGCHLCQLNRFALFDYYTRKDFDAVITDTACMQTQGLGLAAPFAYLHLAPPGTAMPVPP